MGRMQRLHALGRVFGVGVRVEGWVLRSKEFGFRVSEFGFQVAGSESRGSRLGLSVSGFGVQSLEIGIWGSQ